MKLALMQPYLFPYIGYFQLIKAADVFISYDDVQYKKGGWINRNKVLINGEANLFTFSIKSDSTFKNINERYFSEKFDREQQKFLKTLRLSYANAPYFDRTYPLVKEILQYFAANLDKNIGSLITKSLRDLSGFLSIDTEIELSSNIDFDLDNNGQERVIQIANTAGAESYVNMIGGRELYDRKQFQANNIKLEFLKPGISRYDQFTEEFVPRLSVIDVLMFNDLPEIADLLTDYELVY